MSLAELSIKRPTFISCIVILLIAVGYLSAKRMGVDLFPDVQFPVVTVSIPYPGAGPAEVETLISKPAEDEIGSLSGLKRMRSISQEGLGIIIAEFTLETDIKYAEQQVRDRIGAAKRNLPQDIKEPVIRRIDPADQPIITFALNAKLSEAKLFDLADDFIRPKLEQVPRVGLVEILGGRKREVHVSLDRKKLKEFEISATQVAARLASQGENIPAGKVDESKTETLFRTLGEFQKVSDIGNTILSFFGANKPIRVSDVAEVQDTLEDEKSRTFINGVPALTLRVFRQSGSNTIAVVDAIKAQVDKINQELASKEGVPKLELIRDGSLPIRANVDDVKESIYIGIILAVFVVFIFLGSIRSTIITGLALPNSLIGAFILLAAAGFTINLMTLLALSLAVGLLIDDAIVVRENIYRHIEKGEPPLKAARVGTLEVQLAVIATTLVVLAVFGPVAFLQGVVGQFFKQFGLAVCFAMTISLFDALTIAPMLSAYFADAAHKTKKANFFDLTVGRVLKAFDRFQTGLENVYERLLKFTARRPGVVLSFSVVIFFLTMSTIVKVPKTFLPPADNGEFSVGLDLPPGTSLDAMQEVAHKADEIVRKNPEVAITSLSVGNSDGESNVSEAFVRLVPSKQRKLNTTEVKEKIREQLKELAFANPKVKEFDAVGGGLRPFNVNIVGADQKLLEDFSTKAFDWLKTHPALKDVDTTFRPGKPEFQVVPDKQRMEKMGFSVAAVGLELRTQIEGALAGKFREGGREYDVRVRLKEDQRNLREGFKETNVPNINGNLVRLSDISQGIPAQGPAKINRQDRGRYIQINAEIAPGAGMGDVMGEITKRFKTDLPPGLAYSFVGQAENFTELADSLKIAFTLAVLFIFLVLASLYESFVTPFTIMLALPLAVCGAVAALFVTQQSLNIFSIIGVIMLLGVATKNSILLVDYAAQALRRGLSRTDAIIEAGKTRLRPILMTTFALIAGTLPIALGLNEASRQRTSMGIAIIGGLISSTLLTLFVVPAAFSFIDRFREWSLKKMKRIFMDESTVHVVEDLQEKSKIS